ncbi:MAG: Eco57I restriction-modification methylase domain-containing protein, partial [Armatimonadota bacterium]|nr:Eco57I restriction-modification methylase domain-containing protein [Armatimonadota bacterium]
MSRRALPAADTPLQECGAAFVRLVETLAPRCGGYQARDQALRLAACVLFRRLSAHAAPHGVPPDGLGCSIQPAPAGHPLPCLEASAGGVWQAETLSPCAHCPCRGGVPCEPSAALAAALERLPLSAPPVGMGRAASPDLGGAALLGAVCEALLDAHTDARYRGHHGVFYTPWPEADLMCRLAVAEYLSSHVEAAARRLLFSFVLNVDPEERVRASRELTAAGLLGRVSHLLSRVRVLDPACGAGVFLCAMFAVLQELGCRVGIDPGTMRGIARNALFGIDRMGWACHATRLSFAVMTGSTDGAAPRLRCADALLADPKNLFGVDCFDIVLGNPPYVRQEQIEGGEAPGKPGGYKTRLASEMRHAFPEAFGARRARGAGLPPLDGKSDLYLYFYLRGFASLRHPGVLCFITPNSWLDA